MVLALLFRGISFEFRLKGIKSKAFWDVCLFLGSLFATLAQGLILASFVKGFTLTSNSPLDALNQWLTPFGIACSIALTVGYLLLGSNRLISKTIGDLQARFFQISEKLQYLVFLFVIINISNIIKYPIKIKKPPKKGVNFIC